MKNEAAALCNAAEAFQEACNALQEAQQAVEVGDGGSPVLEDVVEVYSGRFRTLSRDIYYLRKALMSVGYQEEEAARYRWLRDVASLAQVMRILNDAPGNIDSAVDAAMQDRT
jgi:hypothetical protein